MKKINNTYIDNLVSKIISETLEERADSLVSKIKSNVNELGGMEDDHPTFGKLNLSKMSDKEIEALLNKPVRGGDDNDMGDEDENLSFEDEQDFLQSWGDEMGMFDDEEELDEEDEVCECGGGLYEGECMECGKSYMDEDIDDVDDLNIDNEFDYFMSIDADFSHHPKYIPPIFQGMTEKDVMIGSRYIPGGGTQNWPLSRKIISTSVNYLVKLLFWMPVRDASGGFRCYRTSKLKEVDFDRVWSKGYSFQQEMLFRVYRCGSKLGEYPIIFEDRRAGSSKVNWKEALRSISLLIYLGTMSRFKRNL